MGWSENGVNVGKAYGWKGSRERDGGMDGWMDGGGEITNKTEKCTYQRKAVGTELRIKTTEGTGAEDRGGGRLEGVEGKEGAGTGKEGMKKRDRR